MCVAWICCHEAATGDLEVEPPGRFGVGDGGTSERGSQPPWSSGRRVALSDVGNAHPLSVGGAHRDARRDVGAWSPADGPGGPARGLRTA